LLHSFEVLLLQACSVDFGWWGQHFEVCLGHATFGFPSMVAGYIVVPLDSYFDDVTCLSRSLQVLFSYDFCHFY